MAEEVEKVDKVVQYARRFAFLADRPLKQHIVPAEPARLVDVLKRGILRHSGRAGKRHRAWARRSGLFLLPLVYTVPKNGAATSERKMRCQRSNNVRDIRSWGVIWHRECFRVFVVFEGEICS